MDKTVCEATNEMRWERRPVLDKEGHHLRVRLILQQKFDLHDELPSLGGECHTIRFNYRHEWRDVPVVDIPKEDGIVIIMVAEET